MPDHEDERLRVLAQYDLMDTPAEQVFDDLAYLASELADCPVALVTLIGAERQWFKARVGIDAQEGSRDVAMCAHMVKNAKPLLVPDARLDPRFQDNPQVSPEDGIRAYAGVPLVVQDQYVVGSICVVDFKPRAFEEERALDILLRLQRQACALLEARRQQRKLEETLLKYKFFFEKSPDLMVIVNNATGERTYNPTLLGTLGYTEEEFVKKPLGHILHPDDRDRALSEMAKLSPEHPLMGLRFRYQHKDGDYRWLEWNAVSSESPPLSLVAARDVSAEQRLLIELGTARDQANAASESKSTFLATMSHELRTPLSAILNLSEAMLDGLYGDLNAEQSETQTLIYESGEHLLSLINDVLDFSKGESSSEPIRRETCSLFEAVKGAATMVQSEALKREQFLEMTLRSGDVRFLADPRRLKQLLVNLLSNAVKFTPNGKRLGIIAEAREAEHMIVFTVWDEGIGIPADKLEAVFEPFVQIDSKLARTQTGTGLGLSLVKQLTAQHGGSVAIESVAGSGTRFTIELPWVRPGGERDASSKPVRRAHVQKALVIEDRPTDAAHITRLMQGMGVTAITTAQAEGALELTTRVLPDVVLLDLYLPDGDGWDVLQALKEHPKTRNIPVFVTSVSEDRAKAERYKADGYIVKPFSEQKLRRELRTVFDTIGVRKPASHTTAPSSAHDTSASPHVLLAEDNPINVRTYSDFLQKKGFHVTTASDGFEAVERGLSHTPRIVLMDIQMPGMDGIEAIQELRRRGFDAPIIALTALAMPGDRERCIQAGANDYLPKPISLRALLETLQRWLMTP